MSDFAHAEKSSRWKWLLLDRATELVIVFISVYAAFLLNAFQIHREENKRRAQLLAYLEQQTSGSAQRLQETVANYDKLMHTFFERLDHGEMPSIDPLNWSSSYNENDTGWILESGGFELLDMQTIARLREVDSVARVGLATMSHYEKLTDVLIAPHLGDRDYFYDPATKKLRPQFQFYLEDWRNGSIFLHTLADARSHLADQLRIEQTRHR